MPTNSLFERCGVGDRLEPKGVISTLENFGIIVQGSETPGGHPSEVRPWATREHGGEQAGSSSGGTGVESK